MELIELRAYILIFNRLQAEKYVLRIARKYQS